MKNMHNGKAATLGLQTAKKKRYRTLFSMIMALLMIVCTIVPVSADTTAAPSGGDTDPLSILTNFTDLVFAVIQSVGILVFIFGLVQFGLAWMNHDPSQRAQALLILVGGLFFFCVKYIINLIAPGSV